MEEINSSNNCNAIDKKLLEKFNNKYKDLLTEDSAYQFFLKVKNDIKKLSKASDLTDFYSLIEFSLEHLSKLKEVESSIFLLSNSLEQFKANQQSINNLEEFLTKYKHYFLLIPETNENKNTFKREFLKFCEENKIKDNILQFYKFFDMFAKDALKNQSFVDAYKFSIKSENSEIIIDTLNQMINSKFMISDKEKQYLVGRTILEIIIKKNLKLAYQVINNFIDKNNNFNNNPPIYNLAFSLVNIMIRSTNDFDHFWAIINLYKGAVEEEYYIQFYLNKISTIYYNKPFIKEEDNFNLLNIMKCFSGQK